MTSIHSLKASVTREQALRHFSASGLRGAARRLALGPLRSLAQVYVPFRIYRVHISNQGKREERFLGIDAVSGTLDLYAFEHPPGPAELVLVETRNRPPASLDELACRRRLIEKVRRILFLTGFFRMRDLAIGAQPLPLEVHVPYWVGFFGQGKRARLAVLDAVRRRPEGARVRQLLQSWLKKDNTSSQ